MAILRNDTTIRSADGQTTSPIITAANIGNYGISTTSTYYIGTTQNVFNRASGAQTLTGVSIDGNAATVTNGVYTTGTQTIGGAKTFSDGITVNTATYNTFTKPSPSTYQTVALFGSTGGGLFLTTDNPIIGVGAYYNTSWIATATSGRQIDFAGGNFTFSAFSGATIGGAASWGTVAQLSSAGVFSATGDFRAPIFYDTNNTAYYCDPASVSNLNAVTLNRSGSDGYLTLPGSVTVSNVSAAEMVIRGLSQLRFSNSTSWDWNSWAGLRYDNAGTTIYLGGPAATSVFTANASPPTVTVSFVGTNNVTSDSNFKGPIFYDSANTAYYLDPANTGTSLLVAGNVGIGTTSPTTKLAISDGTTIAQVNPYSGVAYFGTVNNYPMALSVNSSEKVRIQTDGNVGIGTTSPSYILDANSTNDNAIRIRNGAGGANNGLALSVGSGSPWLDIIEGVEFRIKGNTYANIGTWNSGNNTKLLINSSGNVGIGTTSPSQKLHVVGTGFASTDFRAPIFYDSDNTAYYIDPASTSVLNRINLNTAATAAIQWRAAGVGTISGGYPFYNNASYGSINIEVSDNDSGGLVIDNEGVTVYGAADNGQLFRTIDEDVYQTNGNNVTNATTFWINQGADGGGVIRGTFTSTGDFRAPIFYDSDDTTYYINPAGTSRVSTLYVANSLADSASVNGRIILSGNLHIDAYGANDIYCNYYSGRRFRTFKGVGTGAEVFRTDTDGIVYAYEQLRTPIVYDHNNTSYYLDPASASNLNTVTVNDVLTYGVVAAKSFSVSVNTSTYWTVVRPNGSSIATGYVYRITLCTTGTGTDTGEQYLLANVDSAGWVIKTVTKTGSGSNWPYVFLDAGVPKVKTDHASLYTVTVLVEELNSGNTGGLPSVFGLEGLFTSDNGTPKYRAGWFSSDNTLLHSGNYSGYSAFSGSISSGGNITATGYIYTSTYLQTGGNLIYPSGYGATQRLEVSNSANNNWIDGITIAPGGIVTAPYEMRSPIFYDSDNTAYYINAASTSVLNALTVGGNSVLTTASTLTAGNLSGTIPSAVLGNSTLYVGTTAIALNRGSASQSLTGVNIDGNAGGSSTFVASLGSGLNYDIDRTTKRSGLSHYSGYSSGTNRPTTYDYTLQVTDGNKGWEISMDWIATTGPAIYARSLRDCCQNWSSWVRILDSANYSYAANMNQNVRTTDNVTFANVTGAIFYDAANTAYYIDAASTSNLVGLTVANTITGSVSGNAGTATTLQTARNINGTSFNGSAAITTATWGTARTLTIGSTGKSVDGSAAVSWSLAEIGALPLSGGQITGNTTFSADNHLTFGPNSTWGSSIRIGGNGYTATGTEMASVVTTDGNLHLDAAKSTNGIYLNWYGGTSGVFFGNGSSGQVAFVSNTGNASFSGVVDATQFRDASNTAYYCDPASTSILNRIDLPSGSATINTTTPGQTVYQLNFTGQGTADNAQAITWGWSTSGAQAGIYVQSSGAYGTKMYIATTDSFATGSKTALTIDHTGVVTTNRNYLQATGSLRAPIFYDSDNTAYYIDAASTSNLNVLNAVSSTTLWVRSGSWAGDLTSNGFTREIGMQMTGGSEFVILSKSGQGYTLVDGSYYAYEGGGFYSSFNSSYGAIVGFSADSTSSVTFNCNVKAPIYYDSNNTSYYIDPASTSNLVGLTVTNTITGSISGNSATTTLATKATRANGDFFIDDNYGNTVVGLYSATRLQGVFAMGNSYKLTADGTGVGTLYGLAWSHPNFGGVAANLADHGLLILQNGVFKGAWGGGSLRTPGDVRGTLFYDWDNTAYYCDPASTSNLNAITAAGNVTAAQYYTGGWFRNNGSGNGLYNESTGQHFYSDSANYWNVASSAGAQGIRLRTGGHNGTVRGYFYANDSNDVGFLNSGGNWRARIVGGDYALFDGSSIRGQIFYDSNDTNYYCDPNGSSVLASVSARAYYPVAGVTESDIYAQSLAICAYHHGDSLTYDTFQFNAASTYETRATVGSSFVSGTVETSIFKGDRFGGMSIANGVYQVRWTWNNTIGYKFLKSLYIANSTNGNSFTVTIEASGNGSTWTTIATSTAMSNWPGHSWYNYAWNNNAYQGYIRITVTPSWSTVYSIDIYSMRYFCSYSLDAGSRLYDWDYSKNVTFAAAVSSPIFYDSNNTAYYIDPANSGTSLLVAGNVGIGTTSPTQKLDIVGSYGAADDNSGILKIRGPGVGPTQLNFGVSADGGYGWIQATNIAVDNDRDIILGPLGGNIGIGTTSPSQKLHIVGTGFASNDFRAPIFYDSNDTGYYLDPAGTSNLNKLSAFTMSYNDMNSMHIQSPYVARYNGSTQYRNGTMGHGTVDCNVMFSNWGSGFIDSWGSPANAPGGSTHYVGLQGFHYNHQNNSQAYGFQMLCAGEADNRFFWRSAWPNLRSWVEMIHSGNIGSQTVATAGSCTGNAATATRTSGQSGYPHAGTGMWAFYNWGGSDGGTSAPSASTYTTGLSVGSNPGDQAYGFQIANNMWNTGLWTRNYNSGFGSWIRLLDSSNYVGYSAFTGNVDGTQFRDANNTAYYIDPASTSNLVGLTVANTITGAVSGNAGSVTINYNNDSNSTYQMLWGSGNNVYGTAGVYLNPSTDVLYANAFYDAGNTAYYLDPNSTSNLLLVKTRNTFGERIAVTAASSTTIDTQYNVTELTMSTNVSLTLSNIQSSGTVHMWTIVTVGNGTAYSIGWPAAIKWPGGTAPTITSTNTKRDIYQFVTYDGGTNIYAIIVGQNL